jgi:hypothetical protein
VGIVPLYSIQLRSDEAPTPLTLAYASEDEPSVGDVIVVEQVPMLVDGVGAGVLECRRLWRFRLLDAAARPIGAGSVLTEQRHYGDVETLVLDGPDRFRVLAVRGAASDGFDGAFVVERVPG